MVRLWVLFPFACFGWVLLSGVIMLFAVWFTCLARFFRNACFNVWFMSLSNDLLLLWFAIDLV